jgi:LacI family transcriptional regulator
MHGIRMALQQVGLIIPDEYVRYGNWEYESGITETKVLLSLDPRPTAIFAMNDLMALGAIRVLRARGLSIPKDVSVIGNDRLSLLRDVSPSLATLDMHAFELGRLLMQQLIATVSGKPCPRTTVRVDYIPGETVGPVRRT